MVPPSPETNALKLSFRAVVPASSLIRFDQLADGFSRVLPTHGGVHRSVQGHLQGVQGRVGVAEFQVLVCRPARLISQPAHLGSGVGSDELLFADGLGDGIGGSSRQLPSGFQILNDLHVGRGGLGAGWNLVNGLLLGGHIRRARPRCPVRAVGHVVKHARRDLGVDALLVQRLGTRARALDVLSPG